MALTESTELTHLALNLYQGRLTAVRVKTASVVARDGVEIMRQETDEQALPNAADLTALVGESLAGALATHAALKSELAAEVQAHAEASAQIDQLQGQLATKEADFAKALTDIQQLQIQLAKMTGAAQ